MPDTTTARRQKNRRAKLDAAARAGGWKAWSEYESHIINGAAEMTKKTANTPKIKTTYTVRVPGQSYWWQGGNKREAQKELKKAQQAGLANAEIIEE